MRTTTMDIDVLLDKLEDIAKDISDTYWLNFKSVEMDKKLDDAYDKILQLKEDLEGRREHGEEGRKGECGYKVYAI